MAAHALTLRQRVRLPGFWLAMAMLIAAVVVLPVVVRFGSMKIDPLPMTEIARHRKQASELVDRVGFDN